MQKHYQRIARICVRSDVESVIDIYCSGSYIVFSLSMLHFQCMISLSLLREGVGRWVGWWYFFGSDVERTSEPNICSRVNLARKLGVLCAISLVLSVYFRDPIK